MYNKFLRDFYEERVLRTKCRQFPTFDTFLGLDVSSDFKNTEKLVNGFLTEIYWLWEYERSDNGRE